MFDNPSFDAHEGVVWRRRGRLPRGVGHTLCGLLAEDGARLHAAGVLYAPDYVINAGGIISVGREYPGGASAASIEAEIQKDSRAPDRDLRATARGESSDQRHRRRAGEAADYASVGER
jgi:glutamate dehydrogenase/leucine dehydrogenase